MSQWPSSIGILSAKLRGHYQYYGVRGNFKMLEVAYEGTRAKWKKWLSRRNSKDRMGWEKFAAQVEADLRLAEAAHRACVLRGQQQSCRLVESLTARFLARKGHY